MKNRYEKNRTENLIYGRNVILELLELDKCIIEEIYVHSGIEKSFFKELMLNSKSIKIIELDKQKFETMSDGQKTQGVIAKITPYKYSSLDEILNYAKNKEEDPFLLVLDEIEDPNNLGAIIRSAEVFGVHGVILPKRRSSHISASVFKASAGAVSHIKICIVNNLNSTIDDLKKEGFWIYGSDINASEFSYKVDYKRSIALVVGNEGKGISRLTKEKCDILVKIPMYGKIKCLNASVAAGILMYDINRIRNT